jgi:hypothetical protein
LVFKFLEAPRRSCSPEYVEGYPSIPGLNWKVVFGGRAPFAKRTLQKRSYRAFEAFSIVLFHESNQLFCMHYSTFISLCPLILVQNYFQDGLKRLYQGLQISFVHRHDGRTKTRSQRLPFGQAFVQYLLLLDQSGHNSFLTSKAHGLNILQESSNMLMTI